MNAVLNLMVGFLLVTAIGPHILLYMCILHLSSTNIIFILLFIITNMLQVIILKYVYHMPELQLCC